MEFSQFISNVSDFRRGQGLCYSFESLMWVIFLSICCGYTSSRCISAFCKSEVFTKTFSWKHGIPSYGIIHYFLKGLNSENMCVAFNRWMQSSFGEMNGKLVSGDGQGLGSTLVNSGTCSQSYTSMVSLFCQELGLTVAIKSYQNQAKGQGEQAVLLSLLLDNLSQKGVIFTLDALHCQKKH